MLRRYRLHVPARDAPLATRRVWGAIFAPHTRHLPHLSSGASSAGPCEHPDCPRSRRSAMSKRSAVGMGPLLSDRVAVITGGGAGIGAAAAALFALHGAPVVVAEIDEARGRGAVDDIRRDGGAATLVVAD